MSITSVISALSTVLAVAVCVPQSLLSPGVQPLSLLDGGGSGPLSPSLYPGPAQSSPPLSLPPFPRIPAAPRPPFYSGPAGSPQAAAGFAESAATNVRGISGSHKGLGFRVYQSPSGRFTSGAGFTTNLKGANAVGGFLRINLD